MDCIAAFWSHGGYGRETPFDRLHRELTLTDGGRGTLVNIVRRAAHGRSLEIESPVRVGLCEQ